MRCDMVLKNKLGIENSAESARLEEQISKKKAAQLLKNSQLFQIEVWGFCRFSTHSSGFF